MIGLFGTRPVEETGYVIIGARGCMGPREPTGLIAKLVQIDMVTCQLRRRVVIASSRFGHHPHLITWLPRGQSQYGRDSPMYSKIDVQQTN